jgi:fermentation-respiration switch protein FrsA (DUF1100 family)
MTFPDSVKTVSVEFESEGSSLSGNLYLPAGLTPSERVPGIVVTGSWTTVKEQMAGLYAQRLAERGFVALAFDYRHWGTSEGHPRQYESPERKILDIANAAAYLRTRPEVTADQVGGLAICASAGYLAHAVANGAPFRSIALVASWLHDAATVPAVYGGPTGVAQRVEAARAAREQFERTGAVRYVPAYDPQNAEAAMFFPLDYYAQRDRGAVLEWTNQFAVMSWSEWLTFDGVAVAPSVSVPTLMVHADEAALPENARRFHAALPGPKHLFWTAGTQTDFYDREPQVGLAIDIAVAHFRRTLGSPHGSATLADRQAISDAITELLHAIDRCDWQAVHGILAEQVRTDYTSLFGGSPRMQSASDLIDTWRALVPGFDGTQHLTGPIVANVSANRARARCAATAIHHIGRDYWTVSGHYQMELIRGDGRWAIASITYEHLLVVGDETLPGKAQVRAREAQALKEA